MNAQKISLENKFRCLLFERSSKSEDDAASFSVLYPIHEKLVIGTTTGGAVSTEAVRRMQTASDVSDECVRCLSVLPLNVIQVYRMHQNKNKWRKKNSFTVHLFL